MKKLVAFVLSMMLLTASVAFAESPSVTVTDKTRTNAGTVVTTPTKTVEDVMEEIKKAEEEGKLSEYFGAEEAIEEGSFVADIVDVKMDDAEIIEEEQDGEKVYIIKMAVPGIQHGDAARAFIGLVDAKGDVAWSEHQNTSVSEEDEVVMVFKQDEIEKLWAAEDVLFVFIKK
jgi:hypothetical protein